MNALPQCRVLLVGCGKMGQALIDGWLARGIASADLRAVDPAPGADARGIGVAVSPSPDAVAADFAPDWVVLAVKPQVLTDVATPYRRFARSARFLSILAGKTVASLRAALGAEARVVRAMPNTPAAVGRSMTAAFCGPGIGAPDRTQCEALLRAVGDVVWLDAESSMNTVTAVSGSGPAYVFLLIECLAQAGEEAGLPAALAERLARATVAGAGELARRSPEAAAVLRERVTSPGGTTAAALAVLMDPETGLSPLLSQAVAAAARRSRELAAD